MEAQVVKDRTLLEKLSALEHEQWIEWAKSIRSTELLTYDRQKRWDRYMVPYDQLDENIKEHYRKWARKVLDIINDI